MGIASAGATRNALTKGDLERLKIVRPPLSEQRRIADLLGSLDEKIALNRHMVETLETILRTLFKSWFVDFDPVRAKAEGRPTGLSDKLTAMFPDTLDDGTPSGWTITSVKDICRSIFSGGTPATNEAAYWGGSLPWLSSGETRSHFILGTEKTITEAGVNESSTRLARSGSTVIAGAGQGQTRGQTSMLLLDTYINQSLVALEANSDRCSASFLYFDLSRRYAEFRQISDGQSSRGSLTTKLLAGLRSVLPPPTLGAAFDHIAEPIMARIGSLLAQSIALTTTRDALLPRLISGELRMVDAEARVSAA